MPVSRNAPLPEPVEFSVDDAMLNAWEEDSGEYLRLDQPELTPVEPPSPEHS